MTCECKTSKCWGLFGIFLLAIFLIYWIGIGEYFLFDDAPAITANPYIVQLDSSSALAWLDAIRSSNSGPTGRPVSMLTFTGNAAVSGVDDAVPFKLTNLFIHLVCGILLLGFLRQLRPARDCSGRAVTGLQLPLAALCLAAILWLVAPLHVSTVLYPVQRMAQLATLFVLLGLYLFCRWRRRWAQAGASAGELLGASLWLGLVTLAAMFSKENGLLLLWLLALVEVVCFRGLWAGRSSVWLHRLAWLFLFAPLLFLVLVLLVSPERILGGYDHRDFGLGERLLTQLRVLWLYLGWLVLPLPDRLGFLHDDLVLSSGWLTPVTTLLAGLAWVVVLALAILQYRLRPWLLFGLLFFLIGHSVESGVLALELVFEHRNYLPSAGIAVILAGLFWEVAQRLPGSSHRLLLIALLLPLLLLLGLRTWTWGDEMRMANANAHNHPESARGLYFQARALERRHEQTVMSGMDEMDSLLEARKVLRRMADLQPDSLVPWAALFLFDERWFPGNPEQSLWLEALGSRGGKPVFAAEETNGVSAVLERLLADCDRHAIEAEGLLESLVGGGFAPLDLGEARYGLALCTNDVEQAVRLLTELMQSYPHNSRVWNLYLASAVERGDVGAMYAAAANILALDSGRRQVNRLRALMAD